MVADEHRALARAVFGVLEAALPLQHRPAAVVITGQLAEDAFEVHLSVAQRTEAPGALQPGLKATVHTLLAAGVELGVFHVKDLDALVVVVDVLEVIELLQNKVAGVVEQTGALVAVHAVQKHLVAHAVVQVFTGVNLVADVHARMVKRIQDRLPALGQFVKRGLNQTGRARRPGIQVGPGQRAGEGHVRGQPQIGRSLGRQHHLLDCPLLPQRRVAPHLGRGKAVKARVVGRVHRHQLALQMGGQLGDLQPVASQNALYLLAIGFALRRLLQVKQARVPTRNLHPLVAQTRRPGGNRIQRIEGRGIPRKLGQKNSRSFDGFHGAPRYGCGIGGRAGGARWLTC